jgi:hypothetical protein
MILGGEEMTNLEKEVVDVILNFAREKTLWEYAMFYKSTEKKQPEKLQDITSKYYEKNFDFKEYKDLSLDETRTKYFTIFNKYTTPRVVAAARPSTYGVPPAFQGLTAEDFSEINFITKSRCEVTCKVPNGYKYIYKFIVLKKSSGWLIDRLKTKYRNPDNEWENRIL